MTSGSELATPLAVAFANTRSSADNDRIRTPALFAAWAQGRPLVAQAAASITERDLATLLELRDATQRVLLALAEQAPVPPSDLAAASAAGRRRLPLTLQPGDGGGVHAEVGGAEDVAHLLSRSLVDLLLSPQADALRRCEGTRCRKVFLAARGGRRWCDSQVCGNRARVAAHARRARGDA